MPLGLVLTERLEEPVGDIVPLSPGPLSLTTFDTLRHVCWRDAS